MYAFRLMNLIVHSMQPKQHWAQQKRIDRQQPPGADSNSFSLLRMNSNTKRIISMMATNNEPNAIDPRLYRTTLFADDNTGAHPNSCTQSLCHPSVPTFHIPESSTPKLWFQCQLHSKQWVFQLFRNSDQGNLRCGTRILL